MEDTSNCQEDFEGRPERKNVGEREPFRPINVEAMANGNLYRDTIQGESSRPTLTEVSQARPRRGNGAPSRCASHKSAILGFLRERGPQGVLGSELCKSPDKFGRS